MTIPVAETEKRAQSVAPAPLKQTPFALFVPLYSIWIKTRSRVLGWRLQVETCRTILVGLSVMYNLAVQTIMRTEHY